MKEHASSFARSLATLAPALLGLAMAQTPAASPPAAAAATPAAAPAPAAAPTTTPTIATTHIDAFPPAIVLDGPLDRQRLVVRGLDADGATSDLTDEATYTIADPTRATWNNGAVRPIADGETSITITSRGQTTTLPISIKGAGTPVGDESFRLDVMPALTKGGCNSGACHGSARGQDGFHLTLFGFDPASDYRSITRDQPGRRINLAHAAQSLLLQKAIGGVSHTGGQKFKVDDEKYQTVLSWLSQGARDDAGPVPAVTAIEIFPKTIVLRNGQTQRIVVRARYANGTDRDVTTLATLFSSNDYAAKIGDDAVIRSF
ncbi:MAG: cell surface protein, partial [Planctomycetota bacterium]|nr:cell surface protein [Planctomycetota bacterium]